jgi:uncharacterized protein YjiS (DUF1127 family)
MINNIRIWLKSRAVYAQTRRELRAMSSRELNDIGIDAASIDDIAELSAQKVLTADGFISFLEMFKFPKALTEKDRIHAWLSDSSDIVDLERRIKMLDQNNAPWQSGTNKNIQGWT